MIIQIALGVALGIVGAVVVLRYWRQIFASSVFMLVMLAIVGILVWLGYFVWERRHSVAVYGGALLALAVLYGIPFYLYHRFKTSSPRFNAITQGTAPWDTAARQPLRLLIMAAFALLVAAAGIGALLGSVWLVGAAFGH
jgi:hypothetical protein